MCGQVPNRVATAETLAGLAHAQPATVLTHAYDAEGNRTSSHLSGAYVHDTANRLREDDSACYDYDANGNLTAKTAKVGTACTGAVTTFTWDVLNRLVAIDFPDGTAAEYRYDAQGRRIQKSVNGVLTTYVYDGEAILLEYDGAGALQARYTHGEEVDHPLAMARGGGSYFYHVDHLGSVRLLTDAAGAIVSRYDYDFFGNLEATSFEGVANPYGFTARERDAESGLMFYRARYYDPELGRFISQDPIGFDGGDLNLYRYVFNVPNDFVDPSGTKFNYGLLAANIGINVGLSLLQFTLQEYVLKNSTARWCDAFGNVAITAGGMIAAAVVARSPALIPLALATAAVATVANFAARSATVISCNAAWPDPDSVPLPTGNPPDWGEPHPDNSVPIPGDQA